MSSVIYVAIRKSNGKVMTGAKGQAAFLDEGTLNRSLANAYSYTARQEGLHKASELYDIRSIDVGRAIQNASRTIIVQEREWNRENDGGGYGVEVLVDGELIEGVDLHWNPLDTIIGVLGHLGFDAEEGMPLFDGGGE